MTTCKGCGRTFEPSVKCPAVALSAGLFCYPCFQKTFIDPMYTAKPEEEPESEKSEALTSLG